MILAKALVDMLKDILEDRNDSLGLANKALEDRRQRVRAQVLALDRSITANRAEIDLNDFKLDQLYTYEAESTE